MDLTTTLNVTAQTAFDTQFILNFTEKLDWALLIDWQEKKVGGEYRGKTIDFPIHEAVPPATTPLSEGVDPAAVTTVDSFFAVTIAEYGLPIEASQLTEIVAIDDLETVKIKQVAQNKADTENALCRAAILGATDVVYPATHQTLVTLTAADDAPLDEFIGVLFERAVSKGTPTFDDGTLVAFVHPAGIRRIRNMAQMIVVAEHTTPSLIWRGQGPIEGKKFPGEVFTHSRIRFVEHPLGKLYLGGGAAVTTATAIATTAAVAGDTHLHVTDETGFATGQWITVGTAEAANTEMMLVTSVSADTINVRAAGNVRGNWGCKYDHALATVVACTATPFAIPVVGPKSVAGVLVEGFDRDGHKGVSWVSTRIPNRHKDYYWWNIFGLAKVDKWSTLGLATLGATAGAYGDNLF